MSSVSPKNQGSANNAHTPSEGQLYRIVWKRISGGPGHGEGTAKFTLKQAKKLARELNLEHRDIQHGFEPV